MVLAGVLAKDSLILSAYPCVWNCTLNQAVCECVSVCLFVRVRALKPLFYPNTTFIKCALNAHILRPTEGVGRTPLLKVSALPHHSL